MPIFRCPKCGAELTVKPGTQITKCQYCDTVTYIDRSSALFYYLLPFNISVDKAKGIFKRWTASPAMPKELENGCKITTLKNKFFPVFRFRRTVGGKEQVLIKPARGTTLPGMYNLEIPPGNMVIYDNTVSIGDAEVVQPDVSIDSYVGELTGDAIDQALVYFPIYEIEYEFDNQRYNVVIDASSGRIYAGPAPSRSSASYMGVMGLSFIIGLIGGILCVTVNPIFIVVAAGGFFVGKMMAQKVVEKEPAKAGSGSMSDASGKNASSITSTAASTEVKQ